MAKFVGSIGKGRGGSGSTYKANEMYAARLNDAIKGLGKVALGVYAATTLNNAMRMTHQDSSRAAANWNLHFGNDLPPSGWKPRYYGEFPAGMRGDYGANKEFVISYTAFTWGYKAKGQFMEPTPGGTLDQMLGIGQQGTPPRVVIYNPIFSPANLMYVHNAFGSTAADVLGEIKRGSGGGVPLSTISSEFMPAYIARLAKEIGMNYYRGHK